MVIANRRYAAEVAARPVRRTHPKLNRKWPSRHRATDRLAEQRRALPDQPGVYLFRDARGRVIYVGKAKSISKRVASHFSSPRSQLEHVHRPHRVPGRRTRRPRRCSRSRTSSSSTGRASTSGCATTSPTRTSRSASTRTSRASTSRASATGATAPTSARTRAPSACAARSTCSARSSCSAPARAPSRAAAPARPCLDYYIKRCGAPCVGYVTKEEYREGIDGVIAFLSGRFREIERDLERGCTSPRASRTTSRRRSSATGCRPSGRCSSASAVADRRPGHVRRRRGRRRRDGGQRAGLPGPRRRPRRTASRSTSTTRASRSRRSSPRSSCSSTTRARSRSRR